MRPVTIVSVGDTPTGLIEELAQQRGVVQLVRRCAELAELLAACQSGLAQVAVVAEFAEELTATLVDRLTAVGVSVVAVAASPEETGRLQGIGATAVMEHVSAQQLGEVIRAAVEGRRHSGSRGYAVPVVQLPGLGYDAENSSSAETGTSAVPSVGGGAGRGRQKDERPPALAKVSQRPKTSKSAPPAHPSHAAQPVEPAEPAALAGQATRPDLPSGLGARMPLDWRRGNGKKKQLSSQHAAGSTVPTTTPEVAMAPVPDTSTVVAVWGPIGSPGRTTLAINLAAEQAARGRTVMLIDADCYGASVAAALGLLDESASFAQACRAADQGGLTSARLAKTATQVVFEGGTFSLLTGLTRADRWPELRAAAVGRVLALARQMVELVVVDCGFGLEHDEELSYDTVAPRRNAATLTVLAASDIVYAVGSSDPIGIPRLIRGLAELEQACPGAEVRVVVNKVRRKAVGGHPERSLAQAWERFGPVRGISHFLPWDLELTDKALLEGRLLRELAPDAALSKAIRRLDCASVQRIPEKPVTSATARVDIRG